VTDRDALLSSVLAAPDDDAPRLVLADWLDENGKPERAACIRAQIKLAVMTDETERQELERQAYIRKEWAEPVFRVDSVGGAWSRGFVESVTCTAADWLAHADAILAAHPVVEVRLTTRPDVSEGFLDVTTHADPEPHYYHPRWKTVRFRLPAQPEPASYPARLMRNVGTYEAPVWVELGSPESVEADLAAAREAGARAGMERERRALEILTRGMNAARDRVRDFAAALGRPQRVSRSPTCRYRAWGVPPRRPPP
jgi:uncharacterized protein (TIGR02996 family)